MTIVLLAPLAGWSTSLEEAPDPVFAERMLGDGVAIDPTGAALCAPMAGVVASLAASGHAVALRSEAGFEVLMHIGLDTVALNGEGFQVHVQEGQKVGAGDLLISFDLDLLAVWAKSLLTPVIVTDPAAFVCVWRRQDQAVAQGDPLMAFERVAPKAAAPSHPDAERRRSLVVGLAHGLHARPAARLCALAASFRAELWVEAGDRRAPLTSPIALMGLGLGRGAGAALLARGVDAAAALAVLGDLIETPEPHEGEAGPSAAEARAPVGPPEGALEAPDGAFAFRGVPAAPGYAVGRTVRRRRSELVVPVDGEGPEAEGVKLAQALERLRAELQPGAPGRGAAGAILAAHLALTGDPALAAEARRLISEGRSAAFAWGCAVDAQAAVLLAAGDERITQRVADLEDLKRRLLLLLLGRTEAPTPLPPDAILLADDVLPSELMAFGGEIVGLCTAQGGPTSHAAIIAAGLNLPFVVAAGPGVLAVREGTPAILDAAAGLLVTDPSAEALRKAGARLGARAIARAGAAAAAAGPALTSDGVAVPVYANLAGLKEASAAVGAGAEGCGLLRTEFLFMDRRLPPGEEEQLEAYQSIATALEGRPLVIRTLDIGGDKPAPYLDLPREDNPALGLRGVRTSLWRPELLRAQLRAILRVAPAAGVRVMAPMVASLAEILAVRALLEAEARALGVAVPPLGVMVETPAAAVTTAILAEAADFFSIGANDLTQYALAMDRANPAVAGAVDALHPAVLRLIALACDGAAARGRPVGVCGALASDPLAAPLLIGLGARTLSAAPGMIPEVKAALRKVTRAHCAALAQTSLGAASAREVREALLAAAAPQATETIR